MLSYRPVLRTLALAGLAAGFSLGVQPAQGATITAGTSTLRYTALPGETNKINLAAEGRVLLLTDTGAAPSPRLPSNCSQDPGSATMSIRCTTPGDWLIRIDLGNGDDEVEAEVLPRRFTMRVDGGEGWDLVVGGRGDDQIVGGVGDDTLYGGYGNDLVEGGEGANYVRGNDGDDDLRGGSGVDFMFADNGDDVVHGGGEGDFIYTLNGNDVVFGGGGNDILDLGNGDDVGYGGAGSDELRGGSGADRFYGEGGDDLIRARDGEADRIDCGSGADVARVDAAEVDQARRSCERVREADTS